MSPRLLLLLSVLTALCFAAWSIHSGRWQVPERWNPWAPLRIEAAPNLLTRMKLARLARDPAQCLAVLGSAALRHTPLPDRDLGPGCRLENAVSISATTASVGRPFALACPAAVSLALWEHHVLQPAARAHFGRPVVRIEHLGSYACRNVYGREGARRSQHATARALDIAGFVIEGGQRISVLQDWDDGSTQADFLRDVHRGACRYFDGVLGPEYNAAHRDHLHLDRGPFRVCR
jgi:hypothetical protein